MNFYQSMAPLWKLYYCGKLWIDSWTTDMVNRVKFMKTYSDVLELLNLGIAYKILFTKPSRLPISYDNSVEFPFYRSTFYRSTFISIDSVLFGSIPFCFEYLQGRKVKSQLTSLMQNIRQRPSLLDRGSVPKRSVLSDKYFNLNMVHLRTPNSMKDWHEVVISYFYFIFETCILHMIWNIQRMVYAQRVTDICLKNPT